MPENQILNTPDGTLRYLYWPVEGTPKACLTICHGLGEHVERYQAVASFFNKNGIEVLAMDLRGHGKSHGQRGHVRHLDSFANDLMAALKRHRELRPNTPHFLLGHSLGGLVASYTVLTQKPDIKALVISAAALKLDVNPVLLMLSRILDTVWPQLPFPNGLSSSHLSRDPAVVKAYEDDPMVHDKISPRTACQMMDQGKKVLAAAPSWTVPTMVIIPGSDKIVNPEGSRQFFKALPAGLGECKEYPDTFHEPLNDLNKNEVMQDILAYLQKQLG